MRGVASHQLCLSAEIAVRQYKTLRDNKGCSISVEIMAAIVPIVLENAEGQYSVLKLHADCHCTECKEC